MTLFHFSKVIDHKISASLKNCPKFREHVDHSAIRSAKRDFKTYFPDIDKLRHSVAHHGELTLDDDGTSDSVKVSPGITLGGGGKMLAPEIVSDDKFTGMLNGKTYSFELNSQTRQKLIEITRKTESAFPRDKRF